MRAYCGQTREKGLIKTLRDAGIGECTVRGELKSRKRSPWFYDNGAYRDWTAGVPFNGVRFAGDCRRMRMDQEVGVATPDFVVIPDLVAAGAASLTFSSTWYHDVEGLPCYVAVQDGMTETDVAAWIDEWDARDDADVPAEVRPLAGIFVGGTLEWKLATGAAWVAFAHARGLRCHVGRVGTAERVRWARSIGADSIDSCLPLMYREHLEAFLGALAEPTPAADLSPEPDADERPSDHVQPERQEQDMPTTKKPTDLVWMTPSWTDEPPQVPDVESISEFSMRSPRRLAADQGFGLVDVAHLKPAARMRIVRGIQQYLDEHNAEALRGYTVVGMGVLRHGSSSTYYCLDRDCRWVGEDPDIGRGRRTRHGKLVQEPTCPACWKHDRKRVKVALEILSFSRAKEVRS